MNDHRDWKTKNKPSACTRAPWEYLIPYDLRPMVMRQIRQECIDIYGQSYDECTKRLVCITKSCMGRPLPWKSPTARPYLEKLRETQTIKDSELIISTDCSQCPIVSKCKSLCYQVTDFIGRDKTEEPNIIYNISSTENADCKNLSMPEVPNLELQGGDIPWDCISERKQLVVKKYLYEQLDYRYIAEQLGINNQARAKYELYSALNKLSEFAIMRDFLADNLWELTNNQRYLLEQIYLGNKSFTQVAKDLDISKQSVQQTVSRVVKKYNIKWNKFVRRKGKKLIYSVPELFK
jgi:predicted DNA-binding protein YlxM (UPF0122 family)